MAQTTTQEADPPSALAAARLRAFVVGNSAATPINDTDLLHRLHELLLWHPEQALREGVPELLWAWRARTKVQKLRMLGICAVDSGRGRKQPSLQQRDAARRELLDHVRAVAEDYHQTLAGLQTYNTSQCTADSSDDATAAHLLVAYHTLCATGKLHWHLENWRSRPHWEMVRRHYGAAARLVPNCDKAFAALAKSWHIDGRPLAALYFYVRAAAATNRVLAETVKKNMQLLGRWAAAAANIVATPRRRPSAERKQNSEAPATWELLLTEAFACTSQILEHGHSDAMKAERHSSLPKRLRQICKQLQVTLVHDAVIFESPNRAARVAAICIFVLSLDDNGSVLQCCLSATALTVMSALVSAVVSSGALVTLEATYVAAHWLVVRSEKAERARPRLLPVLAPALLAALQRAPPSTTQIASIPHLAVERELHGFLGLFDSSGRYDLGSALTDPVGTGDEVPAAVSTTAWPKAQVLRLALCANDLLPVAGHCPATKSAALMVGAGQSDDAATTQADTESSTGSDGSSEAGDHVLETQSDSHSSAADGTGSDTSKRRRVEACAHVGGPTSVEEDGSDGRTMSVGSSRLSGGCARARESLAYGYF
mmetsp:Transcript_103174/g.204986  ORF Transcript_103174/g.204986 Transcript_103174/m.204986 type:complete len:600 (-) Transcript_103174:236-2035(-)